jgi:hypothetical protein
MYMFRELVLLLSSVWMVVTVQFCNNFYFNVMSRVGSEVTLQLYHLQTLCNVEWEIRHSWIEFRKCVKDHVSVYGEVLTRNYPSSTERSHDSSRDCSVVIVQCIRRYNCSYALNSTQWRLKVEWWNSSISFNISPRWRWVVSVTLLPPYSRGSRPQVLTVQEGWVGSWAGLDSIEKRNITWPAYNRAPISQSSSRGLEEAIPTDLDVVLRFILILQHISCKRRPWRPTGLWYIDAPTFSSQPVHRSRCGCQLYAPAAELTTGPYFGWKD